jgi:hypothetical protein
MTEKELIDKKLDVYNEDVNLETAMEFRRIILKWFSGNYIVRMGD